MTGATFVVVGCGSAKQDRELIPGQLQVRHYPAEDLYTSTYFEKKRLYAETVGDEWMICSAKHGLVAPDEPLAPYDVSIEDLDEPELGEWADRVGITLIEWLEWARSDGTDVGGLVVLLGQQYLDPLRARDVFGGIDVPVSFPFEEEDLRGIGEQMAWLTDCIEAAEPTASFQTAREIR